MTYKIHHTVLYLAFLVIISSCGKELNTNPTSTIDQGRALLSGNDVQVALVGAYTDFGNTQFVSGQTALDADLLGDFNELTWSGTFAQLTQMKNKLIPVDNSYVASTWLAGYKCINDVNNVLSAISFVLPKDTMRISGEAKFLRASSFFELVRLYAKPWNDGDPTTNPGIPIVLTPTRGITDENRVKRNTVAEVYQQIISDLVDAEQKLTATNGVFATKAAASAMLSRVYLQQRDYVNALQAANRTITVATANNGGLTPAFADAFSAVNNREDIFAVQVTSTSGTNSLYTFYSSLSRGDAQITAPHLALYETGDVRRNFFTVSSGSNYTKKFDIRFGNYHFIRLAEIYLTRAEANFRGGTAIGDAVVNDVNRIRTRVSLPALTAADITLDRILKERKLELSFEGFTLHDSKRLQLPVGNLAWNAPTLIFPIPKRELNVNANLTQNAGYQ